MSHRRPSVISCRKVQSEKAAFLSDFHCPHHDEHTLEILLKFLEWFEPDTVFLVGDFLDFYQISRFDKNPERVGQLQDDLDKGMAVLRRFASSVLVVAYRLHGRQP